MAAKKTVTEVVTIEGVKLDKLKPEVFNTAYKAALKRTEEEFSDREDCQLPDIKTPIGERLKALVLWYRLTTPKGDLSGCDECGGDSDISLDACPFCGSAEVDDAAPPTPPVKAPAKAKAGKGKATDESAAAAEPAPKNRVPKPKPEPKPAKEPKAPKRASVIDTTGALVPSKPMPEINVDEEGEPDEKLTAADLDSATELVGKLKRESATNIWELGRAINAIAEQRLWMLRKTEDGSRAYRTFKQFCVDELDMSYMHTHRLMQVAAAFSEEEMQTIGVSKCHVMLKFPEERRRELLASGSAVETSRTQLSKELQDMKGGEAASLNKLPASAPEILKSGKALTVAMAPGITALQLFARPKGRKDHEPDPVPATSANEEPYATELLPNGVVIKYTIVKNKEGQLVLNIVRKRADKSELFADAEATDKD